MNIAATHAPRPLPALWQRARFWVARVRVMGLDCRLFMRGEVTPYELRTEPLLFGYAMCVVGILPTLVVELLHQLGFI